MGNAAGDLAPLIALNKSRNARSNDKVETYFQKRNVFKSRYIVQKSPGSVQNTELDIRNSFKIIF